MSPSPSVLAEPLRRAARLRSVRALVVLLVLALGGLGWWLDAPGGTPYATGTYGMATGSAGGVYALYGNLFKPSVDHNLPGVTLRLDRSAGGPDNLRRVATGEDAFGIATADAVAHYAGPDEPKLRAMGRLYDDYVQLVVPSDSAIRTVADLRGKRVGTGQPNSGVALIADRVLRVSGIDPAKGQLTEVPVGIDAAPQQLQDGGLDAFFWSGGLPSQGIADLTARARVRLVPLSNLAAPLDDLAAKQDPGARGTQIYRSSTMPASAYPQTVPNVAVATIAVANLMVTRSDLPLGLVQRMTQAVIASRDEIGAHVHSAQLVDIRSAIYTDPLPLAEGARRYYASAKP